MPPNVQRQHAVSLRTITHHFFVSNGPFYFDKTDRVANQDIVKAFRDPTYPFKPGDWNYLVPVSAPDIVTEAPSSVVIGKDIVINVKVSVGGVPSSAADVVYLVLDSAANVVLNGRVLPTNITGTFQVTLNSTQTAKFNAGSYSLKVIAYSWSVITPRFDSRVFTLTPLQKPTPGPTPTPTFIPTPQPTAPVDYTPYAIIGVIAAAIIVVALVLMRKKRGSASLPPPPPPPS